MAERIEDYALIGDLATAALVSKRGAIDWFCAPRFDSPACFAALLGDEDNGRWQIAPVGGYEATRRYRDDTLVLETRFETEGGAATLIDCMAVQPGNGQSNTIVRLVRGERGSVAMHVDLTFRFDYGRTVPWVRRTEAGLRALSGPSAVDFWTSIELEAGDFHHSANFTVSKGEVVPFVMTHHSSSEPIAALPDAVAVVADTERWWRAWTSGCQVEGPWRDDVIRSLITLKALSHAATGGIVAAPTTSLPEAIGGGRNWDYRFCWIRDATFTLYSLLISGLHDEARVWRDWLLRVAAGKPSQLQPVYGPDGERLLPEMKLDWLSGYEGSTPVRIGNFAARQLQLDIYGEIMDVFHVSRRSGILETDDSWALQQALIDFVESGWRKVDHSIWEVRGPRRHFTHSKVMAWVALDRAVKGIEAFGLEGPLDRWKGLRAAIHEEVCRSGFSSEKNAFVQYFGGDTLDAALLQIPLVGFLPITDMRVQGTLAAIGHELSEDGFIRRYTPNMHIDGLAGVEGVFLPCTFWLADNYAMLGRRQEATRIFEGLLAISNDVGLLAEEYDPAARRLLGNFPQAFSHVSLINTAWNLSHRHEGVGPERGRSAGPAGRRAG